MELKWQQTEKHPAFYTLNLFTLLFEHKHMKLT